MRPHAVVFDAVGTLLFPQPAAEIVYASAAARFGLAIDPGTIRERFYQAFSREESHDAEAGWRVDEARELARWQTIVADVLPGSTEECFRYLYDYFARPVSWHVPNDAIDTIQALSTHNIKLGIASNLDARIHPILAGHPKLAACVPHVCVSSEIGYRKPDSRFFEHVAHTMACRPQDILYVGDDRRNDYDGARTAGFTAILLDPHGRHPEVPHRIARLSELENIFI